jgi:hypothetical protein
MQLKKKSAKRPQHQQQQLQQLQQRQHHHLPQIGRSTPQGSGTFLIMKIQICLDAICFEKSMILKMTALTNFFFQLHQQSFKQLR